MAQQMRSPFENLASDAEAVLEKAASSKARCSSSLLNRLLGRVVPLSSRAGSTSLADAKQEPKSWTDLPNHLLEDIFDLLLKDSKSNPASRRDMFAAVSVCKVWRRTGFEQFFLRPWAGADDIVHPLQLLSLSGRAVAGNLLHCFMRREETPKHGIGAARYCLYLGAAHTDTGATPKFLLAALQTSRREILAYLDRQCEGRPIARLSCSLLQMHYRITVTDGCALPFVDTLTRPDSLGRRPSLASMLLERLGSRTSLPDDAAVQLARLPPVLAEVQYHMRLKGFMRPRKMRVTLPHPLELACFDMDVPAATQRLASVCGTCPLPEPDSGSRSGRPFKRSGSSPLGSSLLLRLRSSGAVMAAANSAPVSAIDAAADAALEAAGLVPAASLPSNSERLPLGLRNKQPHWNDNLRCHCLNFHGRVKEASVKNFQLVCSDAALAAALSAAAEPPPGASRPTPSRAARSVAMQFGKVEPDLYILDYNPTVLTGLQAFCVALTNFDCKLLV